MRILPILFNTDMVRAILEGRKKATRRVIKFPKNRFTGEIPKADKLKVYKNTILADKISFHEEPHFAFDVKPPCKTGDILYVRETWAWEPCWDCGMDTEEGGCDYEYERVYNQKKKEYGCYCYRASMEMGEELSVDTWHPSIHMSKAAARIWLKVTDVRVERLRDMSEEQVKAEGVYFNHELMAWTWKHKANRRTCHAYIGMYSAMKALWNSTVKEKDKDKYDWNANPWVWVIEFERCKEPEEWSV